jgi:hypothetical protein
MYWIFTVEDMSIIRAQANKPSNEDTLVTRISYQYEEGKILSCTMKESKNYFSGIPSMIARDNPLVRRGKAKPYEILVDDRLTLNIQLYEDSATHVPAKIEYNRFKNELLAYAKNLVKTYIPPEQKKPQQNNTYNTIHKTAPNMYTPTTEEPKQTSTQAKEVEGKVNPGELIPGNMSIDEYLKQQADSTTMYDKK